MYLVRDCLTVSKVNTWILVQIEIFSSTIENDFLAIKNKKI